MVSKMNINDGIKEPTYRRENCITMVSTNYAQKFPRSLICNYSSGQFSSFIGEEIGRTEKFIVACLNIFHKALLDVSLCYYVSIM